MRKLSAFPPAISLLVLTAPQALWAQDRRLTALDEEVWTIGFPTDNAGNAAAAQITPIEIMAVETPDLVTNNNQPLTPDDSDNFRIGAVGVVGSDALEADVFSPVVEAFIGREADEEELASLTQQIADIARENGLIFASAYIPEQAVQLGVLEIKLIEGHIDQVRIIGSDNAYLKASLASLEGKVARKSEIERKILLAGDIPNIRVRSTEFLQEGGQNILQVTVRERGDRLRLQADNYGSDSFGPVRARISGDLRGKIHSADALGLAVRTNPIEPSELLSVSGYYETAIGKNGLRAGLAGSIGDTSPSSNIAGSDLSGTSRYLALFASYPLVRASSGSLWIETEAAYLSIDREDMNALIREDTEVTLSFGVRGEIPFAGGRFRAGAAIVQGFDIFDATRFGDPFASRSDGDGIFTKGEYWADFRTGLTKDLSIYLAARGQIASRPLLAAQELGIGGAYRVRGFDFSELSGDDGFYGLAELRYKFRSRPSWLRRLQIYGFIDMGYVNDLGSNFSEGTLLSAGPGLRGTIGPFDFELEAALPINRDRDNSENKDPHLNVRVGMGF
ncbi:MAG: ShlB/FhaC/HecB family hemolysin secretion/activation protein [Parasphingorhabdus sp.]|uniref:ShlB/FhaC/HecB family hemolysin secretion/activation protein n=1 Tax=Parasphingorhabdus sp. TaxID=2709688 RepID=UPI003299CFCD